MQQVDKTRENLQKCRCSECPSYTLGCKIKNYPVNFWRMIEGLDNLEHFEGMFCAYGESNCIEEDRGCLCEDCDIFQQYKLNRAEYCLNEGGNSRCGCKDCPAM